MSANMFTNIFSSLLVSVALASIFVGESQASINIEKADIESMDKEYMSVTVKIRQEDSKSVMDVDSETLQDLNDDVYMQVQIDKKIDGTYRPLYKSEVINKCHFVENRDKYPMLAALTEDFNKHGNLMQSCPVKKGHTYLKGFVLEPRGVIAEKMVPGEYTLHFIMMKEINTQMKTLFSIRIFATAQ